MGRLGYEWIIDILTRPVQKTISLQNIHILIDNCTRHGLQSFVDCFAGYHQILMHDEDAEKTLFTIPWGVYCYRVMSFDLKNAGATYMRDMMTLFHDMIHKEIEVYVDDVNIKSQKSAEHLNNLKKFIEVLQRYSLKLNPAKCPFGVPAGKLLGFIVSRKGIELDPSKIKAIQDLPSPKSKKDVMSFLGRLNYISIFIAESTIICEPIFKLLKKDTATKWTKECQKAFKKIKEYLSNPAVLIPFELGKPLLLYLLEVEALHVDILISRLDPLKYIFQKPIPTGKLAKWQILLNEFDIVYITQKAIKGQDLAYHLAENLVDKDYEPLTTYFSDKEVLFVGEEIAESYQGWRMLFNRAANFKGVGIGAVLISESGPHYLSSAKIRFPCTNIISECEACILGIRMTVDMNIKELLVIGDSDMLILKENGLPRTLRSFHIYKNYIYPIDIEIKDQHAYYFHVDEELDSKSWYYDIKWFLKTREYPKNATNVQKRALRRLENHFFLNGEVLYRRTLELGLFRCVDAAKGTKLLEEIHAGTCKPHMNGFTLAKKILRGGYFWMTLERHSIRYVHKCHQCQIHGDFIRVPPSEFNSLQHLFEQMELNLRQQRWLELLNDYDITILYYPGKANMVADALSRKAKSMGSLEFIPTMERPLAMDVQALTNRLVRLDISNPSRVLACIVAQSFLFECIKDRLYDDPHLLP
ncbi:uncharacterized protein [Nicotiana tomentosiformis]|uniref:uncharacterized protein n=1 Tax=Nicotiana tomentosiformis TaxID=4098 RepID=UPI00388CB8C5